jgi:hypothetical protein
MGWATRYIEQLKAGETVQFRPRGNSMAGRISSGQLCTVVPADPAQVRVDRGHINGWISGAAIFGRCVKVEA